MKNLMLLFFAAFLALTSFTFSQSTIFSNNCSAATTGWTFTNGGTGTGSLLAIQQSGYWLLDNTADAIISAPVDVSVYTSLTLTFNVATYGSGTNQPGKVEYSTDGGSTWSGTTFTTATPTSSTYISAGTWNLGTIVSTQLVFRFTCPTYTGTGKGVRMQAILFQGVRPLQDGDGSAVLSNVIGSGNLNNTTIFPINTSGQSVKLEVTGTSIGTLGMVSVTIPYLWGWDGTSVAPSGDDGASLTGQSISGSGSSLDPYIVSYTGSITNTNIARITISNLTSGNPSALTDNGNYSFVVKTAQSAGTLTTIATTPVAYVIVPMSHIRNESGGIAVLLNSYVATVGVATLASGVFSTTQLQSYMQDATAGCNVFSYTPSTIVEGESYIVKGQIQQYNGNTELAPLLTTDIIDNGASVMPAYQVVTIPVLLANPENYEGMYIAVQSLSLFTGTWPATTTNTPLVFHDGSANSLNVYIYGTTDVHSNTQPTWPEDVKGIFVQTASTPVYSLEPRYFAQDFAANNSLPVELSSFTSTMNGRNVQLNWETKTEVAFNKFEIDRASVNANDASVTWTSVGTVPASGTSNSPRKYSYTEKDLQAGKYQYRLKMIDNDGSYKLSDIVETDITSPKNFELSQNYPNPFNPSTKINYSLPYDSRVTLEIYNVLGARVGQLVNQEQSAGFYTVDFNSSSLGKGISSGVYLYKITTVDKATGNNFSSIRKMMLLK